MPSDPPPPHAQPSGKRPGGAPASASATPSLPFASDGSFFDAALKMQQAEQRQQPGNDRAAAPTAAVPPAGVKPGGLVLKRNGPAAPVVVRPGPDKKPKTESGAGTTAPVDGSEKPAAESGDEAGGGGGGGGVLKSHYLQEMERWSAKSGDRTQAGGRPLMK